MSCEEKCPSCGSGRDKTVYVPNSGQYCCGNCGLVIGQEYVQTPERAYDAEEAVARLHHGKPEYFGSLQKGSELSRYARSDSRGKSLSGEQRSLYRRLAKTNNRSYDYKQRKLTTALKEMERIRSQLNIPRVAVQDGMATYEQAINLGVGRGKSIEALAVAALIIASRKSKQTAIIARQIMTLANASPKDIAACVRFIQTQLKLKYTQLDLRRLCLSTCDRLDLTMQTSRVALDVLDSVRSAGLTIGKHPASLVAAAVYIATVQSGERRTQQQVAEAAMTTPVTIRNRFKEIVETLKLDGVNPSRGVGATPVYRKKNPRKS